MPATQTLGQSYYQEFAAADDALDQAETSAIGLTVIAGGRTFSDLVRVYETSALDPDAREFKYYAPGIGLILAEEGLDANRMNPELTLALVAAVPEPWSALLLCWGCRCSLPATKGALKGAQTRKRMRQRAGS